MKPVEWVGRSYESWKSFPEEVQDSMGFALSEVQSGSKPDDAKPLNKGILQGLSILEIVSDFNSDT